MRILVQDDPEECSAREILEKVGAQLAAVEFHRLQTDRVWTRDFAPLFVTAPGKVAPVKWRFNAWAKYENWQLDDTAGLEIAKIAGGHLWNPTMVLEGGSVDVNGAGWLMTTEECLLSPIQARNPDLSREEVESELRDYLGIDQILWLRNGIAGDDTHGHIDDLARFVKPDTIVIVCEPDPSDPNHEPLRENRELLKQYPFRVVQLPMPAPIVFDGQRLPASYANFYIANGIVLVPTFNDPNDRVALNTLAEVMSNRKVIGINCNELVWGLGTLHC